MVPSYGCCDDSRSCDQLKNGVTDKYIKKRLVFEPVSFPFRKCSYNCNTWVTGVYMAYMFEWNSGGKTSQIEWLLESNLKSFGYFKCSTALEIFLDHSSKDNSLTKKNWLRTSGPDCHLVPKIGICKKRKLQWNCKYSLLSIIVFIY